jgi:(R,R)-butanediol dehydrogenase/meso-butanediol dehydrogenase/diacetyl reductase
MLGACYAGDHQIAIRELDAVAPTAGQVRIRVAYNGICGTDLHIFHGQMDDRVAVPRVIGHEMAGTIESVGADVRGLCVGDPVTVMPLQWCGHCAACLAGHRHVCQSLDFLGIDSPGALQELWTVPAEAVMPLPRGLALDRAALAEPTAVAIHDVRRAGLQAGERAVVLGGGPIGALIALVARAAGADVLMLEPNPDRREVAMRMAVAAHDPSDDVQARIAQWTSGAGADVVFEASGAEAAVALTTELACVRGRIVLVGIHAQARRVDLHRVFLRELTIVGARVYERTDFDYAIRLLSKGDTIPVAALVSSVVPLSRTPEAFSLLERGAAMKVLIQCTAGGP